MTSELKLLVILLLVTQLLIRVIHNLVTTMNLFATIIFLIPIVLAVSWYRKIKPDLEKRKLAKYILMAFPIPVLLGLLLYGLLASGYQSPVPQPMSYIYIHFAVWAMVLIYALSTYTRKTV